MNQKLLLMILIVILLVGLCMLIPFFNGNDTTLIEYEGRLPGDGEYPGDLVMPESWSQCDLISDNSLACFIPIETHQCAVINWGQTRDLLSTVEIVSATIALSADDTRYVVLDFQYTTDESSLVHHYYTFALGDQVGNVGC